MKLDSDTLVYIHQIDPPAREPVFHRFYTGRSGATLTTCGLAVEARHTWSVVLPAWRARKFAAGCGRCLVS